jgi:hypothetical protein
LFSYPYLSIRDQRQPALFSTAYGTTVDNFLNTQLQNHLLYIGLTNVEIPGDFNGDGLMDLIGLVKWDNQWVSYSQGDGTFSDQSLSQPWTQLYDLL